MNEEDLAGSYIITDITKIEKGMISFVKKPVIKEVPLMIYINNTLYATLYSTPGHEKELALGFCFTEGLLPDDFSSGINDLQWEKFDPHRHIISLKLKSESMLSHSSCFSCLNKSDYPENKTDYHDLLGDEDQIEDQLIDNILTSFGNINNNFKISIKTFDKIESQLKAKQRLFSLTGATHAAAVFDGQGNYLFCYEDIARHNALDKAIGHALLEGIDLSDKILFLSGRTNYTLIRKATRARFFIVASVSAPTALAVKTSKTIGLTLIGFLRFKEMNIYAGYHRIEELKKEIEGID